MDSPLANTPELRRAQLFATFMHAGNHDDAAMCLDDPRARALLRGWSAIRRGQLTLGSKEPTCRAMSSMTHGTGLFAKRFIRAGQTITLFPAHGIVVTVGGHHFSMWSDGDLRPGAASIDDYSTGIPGISLVGDPRRLDDPRFLAHMCNDPTPTDEAASLVLRNAVLITTVVRDACAQDVAVVALVATRDISADDEITISYGHRYWTRRGFAVANAVTLPAVRPGQSLSAVVTEQLRAVERTLNKPGYGR
jgi:hypothetical protein